jgi:polysaccharide biosynthesis/export protein
VSMRLFRTVACCGVGIATGVLTVAQTATRSSPQTLDPAAASIQRRANADQDKSSRAAATPEQIRTVLAKNPGLLVELEREAEREATAKGQIVEDSDLTQQAIFDRLDDDVAFRATATQLLQRYGYLLPTVNPNSEMGKEQELVLKERARRLVQIESQEDAEALRPSPRSDQQMQETAKTDNCEPRGDAECNGSLSRSLREKQDSSNEQPSVIPDGPSNLNLPPQVNAPLIETGLYGGRTGGADESDSGDLLRMAAMSVPRSSSSFPYSAGVPDQSVMHSGVGSPNLADLLGRSDPGISNANKNESVGSQPPKIGTILHKPTDGDSPQGAILAKRSPYSDVPSLVDLYVQVATPAKAPTRFGTDILSSGSRTSNAILMDLPAGPDYVVGPGDGLAIDLWGGVTQRLQRTVDTAGRISLPEYGPILVSGKTLGNVQLTIQQLLRTQLRNISTDVSLSKLRSVRVYVVGEVAEPGAYDISSLSSPLNALVAAGGVTERGSLREIKHFRGRQLLEVVDAYDLLLRGVGPAQSKLQSGDSLLVPPVGPQVTIEGMVRRPAIYEIRGDTTLGDALELAGGVLPAAALKHVQVERLVAHENRTMFSLDLSDSDSAGVESQLQSFRVQDGDRIHIFPIAPYNEQAVYVQGHVLRPGRYSYREGMTVRDVIASYSDLLPEPAGNYAEIIRLNAPDYRPSVESFDLTAALANPDTAPKLKPLDTVRVFSKYDFQPAPDVSIDGQVRAPGKYTTSGQARLRDAIYLAGGLTADADRDSAQVFRLNPNGTMRILSVNLEQALEGHESANILLQPHDRLVVQRNGASIEPSVVYVKGDVANPGRYPLTADMHVEDLVRAAGGVKPSADSQNAMLEHRDQDGTEIQSLKVNVSAALNGSADENKILANGDVLTIPKNPTWNELGATVTIRGEVRHPGTYGIRPGESLNSVLAKAGGFTSQAYPYGTVLTRREVRDLEMKSQEELVARIKAEQAQLKALPENDADQKNLKLNAIAETETTLTQLEAHLPVGRVVLNSGLNEKSFDRAAGQTPLRNGDTILVPKKPNYVVVQGQVYNATAVGYVPGRSANWYLGQAGGPTAIADKKGVFVIRADGSVLAAKNNRTLWSGDPMDAELMPGDVIVVPEKAPKVGTRNWLPLMQTAQVATSVALAVAYLKP